MTKPAAIYARISLDQRKGTEREGQGVERQIKDCQALAAKLGIDVPDAYVLSDNDVSAYKRRPRPGYDRLLSLMTEGAIGAVIIWHHDRLLRNKLDLEHYIEISNIHKIPTHQVQSALLDLATPSGRLSARVVADVAVYESEHKGERVKAARVDNISRSKRLGGGLRPFGFQRYPQHKQPARYELDPIEAPLVKAAIEDLTAKRRTLGQVARDWNAAKVRTVGGKSWNNNLLSSVLKRPSNGGLQFWTDDDGIEQEATIDGPRIVEPELMRAFLAVMNDPSRRSSPSWEPRHLMSGLALCGRCTSPMRSASTRKKSGKQFQVYRCTGPNCYTTINRAVVDRQVLAEVVGYYTQWQPPAEPALAGTADAQILAVNTRLIEIETEQKELLSMRKWFPAKHVEAEATKLKNEHKALTKTLTELVTQDAQRSLVALAQRALRLDHDGIPEGIPERMQELGEAFSALPLADRRAIVRSKFVVTVKTGGRGVGRVDVDLTPEFAEELSWTVSPALAV